MSLVVATEPSSLVAVENQCSMVEAWAESCDSIPQLRDASNKLAAISEYLELTATEGRARVAAAQRRLEVRIGHLLGPTTPGERHDLGPSIVTEGSDALTKDQRHDFRRMAENEPIVEDVIASSTDEAPASRRRVTEAIKATKPEPTKPRRSPLPDAAQRAGWDFRRAVERLERLTADDRFPANREQVAAALRGHLTYATEVLHDLLVALDTDPQEDR